MPSYGVLLHLGNPAYDLYGLWHVMQFLEHFHALNAEHLALKAVAHGRIGGHLEVPDEALFSEDLALAEEEHLDLLLLVAAVGDLGDFGEGVDAGVEGGAQAFVGALASQVLHHGLHVVGGLDVHAANAGELTREDDEDLIVGEPFLK